MIVSRPAGVTPTALAVLTDGVQEQRLTWDAFRSTALEPSPHTAWHPAATRGEMQVRVEVRDGPGEALGAGALIVPLEDGWLWTVEALVYRPSAGIPAPPCFNCDIVTKVPLRASAPAGVATGDSLFLRAARRPAAGRQPLPPS